MHTIFVCQLYIHKDERSKTMGNTAEHKQKNETQKKTLKITIEAFTIPKYQLLKTSYY